MLLLSLSSSVCTSSRKMCSSTCPWLQTAGSGALEESWPTHVLICLTGTKVGIRYNRFTTRNNFNDLHEVREDSSTVLHSIPHTLSRGTGLLYVYSILLQRCLRQTVATHVQLCWTRWAVTTPSTLLQQLPLMQPKMETKLHPA